MSTTETTEIESTELEQPDLEQADTDQPDLESDAEETESPNREAAKWRSKLRETESTLAEVQNLLDGVQRQVIGQMVEAECQISPEVLFAAGTQVSDLVEADGSVNRDAVRQAGDNAAQALNVARSPRSPRPDPNQGRLGAGISSGDSWSNAFAPG